MKNNFTPFLLLINLLAVPPALAHESSFDTHAAEAETVTAADLGIENPGLLPTNPFYFLKEISRTAKRIFTFNPIRKTELELQIANEKAAELKKVEETRPAEKEAIAKALVNYEEAQDRLKNRLQSLSETSENPNVDRLLNELTDRTVKHRKLFDEIAEKFKDAPDIQNTIDKLKEKTEETVTAGAQKDDPAKFIAKLENALVAAKGGELKHIQSVEFLDRLEEKAPKETQPALKRLKNDFSERLEEDIKEVLEKEGAQKLETSLRTLPGGAARRSVILEEIRGETAITAALKSAAQKLEKEIREEKNISEKAEEKVIAKPLPAPLSVSIAKPVSSCGSLKENLNQLWESFKAGKISEKDYNEKYETVKKELAVCEETLKVPAAAVPAPAPIPTPTPLPTPENGQTGFHSAYWQCYDGKEFKDSASCQTSEEWQKKAARFCEGHCYEDKSKCGVNTYSVTDSCQLNQFPSF